MTARRLLVFVSLIVLCLAALGEIVQSSVQAGVDRLKGIPTAPLRPWLQDFDDYGTRKLPYGATQVRAQIDAATVADSYGWLLWDPTGVYSDGGLEKK